MERESRKIPTEVAGMQSWMPEMARDSDVRTSRLEAVALTFEGH